MTVREILIEWLNANEGYDGLCNLHGGCGCVIDDLIPCGDWMNEHCEAGHSGKPSEDSECEDCDFVVYPGKRRVGRKSVPFEKSEVSLKFGWYDIDKGETVYKEAKVQGDIYKGLVVHRRQVMEGEGVFVEGKGWKVSHIQSGQSIMGKREPFKTLKKAKEYCVLMAEAADWTQTKTYIERHKRVYSSK